MKGSERSVEGSEKVSAAAQRRLALSARWLAVGLNTHRTDGVVRVGGCLAFVVTMMALVSISTVSLLTCMFEGPYCWYSGTPRLI